MIGIVTLNEDVKTIRVVAQFRDLIIYRIID